MNHVEIKTLFNALAKEGAQAYINPDGADWYESLAMALTQISDNTTGVIRLAYAFLEGWNFHSENSVLNVLMRGKLYPVREYNLEQTKRVLDGVHEVTDMDGNRRKFKVTFTYEEVK